MGPEDKVEFSIGVDPNEAIPGLDLDVTLNADDKSKNKKVPYSKPIPRNFQANWNETGGTLIYKKNDLFLLFVLFFAFL